MNQISKFCNLEIGSACKSKAKSGIQEDSKTKARSNSTRIRASQLNQAKQIWKTGKEIWKKKK
jgi:hypothetical protein